MNERGGGQGAQPVLDPEALPTVCNPAAGCSRFHVQRRGRGATAAFLAGCTIEKQGISLKGWGRGGGGERGLR